MPDGFDAATGEVLDHAPDLYDYVIHGDAGKLFEALAKAQGEIRNATKDSQNPHFKSRYADLASVSEACRAALSKNGIAVVQVPHNDGKDIAVTTILGHASGARVSGKLKVQPAKWDAQGVGSVVTYLRRYALAAMAGVAPGDDDDGEAAVGRGEATMSAPAGRGKPKPPPESDATIQARKYFKQIADGIRASRTQDDLDAHYDAMSDARKYVKEHGGEEAAKELDRRYGERREALLEEAA